MDIKSCDVVNKILKPCAFTFSKKHRKCLSFKNFFLNKKRGWGLSSFARRQPSDDFRNQTTIFTNKVPSKFLRTLGATRIIPYFGCNPIPYFFSSVGTLYHTFFYKRSWFNGLIFLLRIVNLCLTTIFLINHSSKSAPPYSSKSHSVFWL